jgi:two-component system CheB/CheR fusion protein
MVKSAIRARERQYQVRNHLAERKQAEQALQVARESAEAANRAKDQFLAVLSHELRTPLSPVLMCITAMEKDPTLAAPLHADVEMMRRNIELESRLIDDLLDLSRVTTGKLRLRIDHIALHEVLKYVFQVCESDLLAKELHLVRELDAADDQVMGDSARLQQVFWNLLKNAIKFSPRGQQILVRTSTPSPGRLKVEVRDYGVGIPADVLPRLFNAFEQGNPAVTHQFGGLGLGLAISKAVVDLHGGSIEATSQGRGYGATFSVELLAAEPGHDHRHGNGQFKSDANRQSLRVLFVEDHPDTANVMTRLLSSLGYQVRTANSVAAALQCAAAEKFDILVSDIGLPDASGYELMEQIRDRYRMKGIALSGYGMEGDVQRGKAAGFADHITKPVSVAQLQAAIQRVVRSGDSD